MIATGLNVMPEQFQEKWVAIFRLELRKNRNLERFRVSVRDRNALGWVLV